MKKDAKNHQIAILGQNIDYTLSPSLFNTPFIQARFPNEFSIVNLNETNEWNSFWSSNEYLKYDLLCVTTPWKKHPIMLNNVSDKTREVDSSQVTNWVQPVAGSLKLINTDACAFEYWWNALPKTPKHIYYLSTGASLLSFLSMLKSKYSSLDKNNQPAISIVSRENKTDKSHPLYKELKVSFITYKDFYGQNLDHQTLIINGTPYGQKMNMPIEVTKCLEQTMVWDLNYALDKTYYSFYMKSGLEFLIYQALSLLLQLKVISPSEIQKFFTEISNHLKTIAPRSIN